MTVFQLPAHICPFWPLFWKFFPSPFKTWHRFLAKKRKKTCFEPGLRLLGPFSKKCLVLSAWTFLTLQNGSKFWPQNGGSQNPQGPENSAWIFFGQRISLVGGFGPQNGPFLGPKNDHFLINFSSKIL